MVAQLTKDWLDGVLGKYENAPVDSHAYGVVTSVNADGSYQVQLNSSTERARCAAFCSASLGDKVLVLIFSDGRAAAIGTLGGEGGGGGGTSSDMAFTVLFQPDDPAGTSEDFSLTESAGNFEILEFQYTDGDRYMTKRVYQPNGKYVALDRSVANPEKGMYTHSAIAHINGSSVTLSNFGGLCVTVNGTPEYQNIETIKVTAVLGWSNATEFPNPSNYYLKAEVDTAIEEAVAGIDVPDVDLSNYYTKAETNAQIAAHVPDIDLSDYYTKPEVDDLIAGAGGGGTGLFAMEVDADGNLYCVYEDEGAAPSFELDDAGNLYYVIEE